MADRKPVVLVPFSNGTQIDENTFAVFAENIMSKRSTDFPKLTTTKLRNIYGQIMNLYSKIGTEEDFEKSAGDLQYLKVKMAYDAGREPAVKDFLTKTYLMVSIGRIKTYKQFQLYCRYAESLVAYFKYYGGEEK